jgi:hypothetical protein
MNPTAPFAKQLQCDCHDTLPWLISFSLDREAERASKDNEQDF